MILRIALTMTLASLVLALPTITHATEPRQRGGHPIRCESAHRNKPVPAEQLQATVESHGQWLEQRANPENRRADFCQTDLPHAKLAGANLEQAALDKTILRQANL